MRELIALDNNAKVWIYQADRELAEEEISRLMPMLYSFIEKWTSHNLALKAYGNVFHQRFLVLFVDESQSIASGCSIDKSVHFIEYLGEEFGIDFFNRMQFAYLENDEIHTLYKDELSDALANGVIAENTLMFDNLVKTKAEFIKSWLKPLKESWHRQFVA